MYINPVFWYEDFKLKEEFSLHATKSFSINARVNLPTEEIFYEFFDKDSNKIGNLKISPSNSFFILLVKIEQVSGFHQSDIISEIEKICHFHGISLIPCHYLMKVRCQLSNIKTGLKNKAELLKSIEEIQQLKKNNNQIFAKQIKI